MSIAGRILEKLCKLPPAKTRDIAVKRDVEIPMPDGTQSIRLPDGRLIPRRPEEATFQEAASPGIYTFVLEDHEIPFAVNLPAEESLTQPMIEAKQAQMPQPSVRHEGEQEGCYQAQDSQSSEDQQKGLELFFVDRHEEDHLTLSPPHMFPVGRGRVTGQYQV